METTLIKKERLNGRIKSYRHTLNELMKDYNLIDETMALELDEKINNVARKLINAKHRVAILNN